MKIELFNVCGGQIGTKLSNYLANMAPQTDVFCFQKANNQFPNIAGMAIRGFDKFEVSKQDVFAQMTMVRKGLKVETDWPVLKDVSGVGLGLVTEIATRWGVYTVVNFHGVPLCPGDKLDTPEQLKQSRLLIECFNNTKRLIIGGDFNLKPETRSVFLLEEAGFINLTKQCCVCGVFVRGVKVKDFKVINNLVSDHLPMQLEIE